MNADDQDYSEIPMPILQRERESRIGVFEMMAKFQQWQDKGYETQHIWVELEAPNGGPVKRLGVQAKGHPEEGILLYV